MDNKPPLPDGSDLDSLGARELELQAKIAQLQDFVENGPDRLIQAERDRLSTLPPPVEVEERKREKEFMDKLGRGALKNEKRHQAKNGFLLILLILTILVLVFWIYQTVTQ